LECSYQPHIQGQGAAGSLLFLVSCDEIRIPSSFFLKRDFLFERDFVLCLFVRVAHAEYKLMGPAEA